MAGGVVTEAPAAEIPAILPAETVISGWNPVFGEPTLTGSALRSVSYRAFGTLGLNPDHLGPAGCGYHAMLDIVGFVGDATGAGRAVRSGLTMWNGAMDIRTQFCPMTNFLSQTTGSWTDGFGLLHPEPCEEDGA
ncbi:hypothetical protein RXV86_13980 [Alisedimentitalea sp. MJ-SS2]|uniref:hypothetical protein n=1 Tax=Aliisedimentitalea sp. MJ-SS2 TaxID=3049795 RepID=UPI00290AE2F3|nr:hypothetical protein [Alisedimentitalea sp. MJ-SS2]MDU8928495.1 hypothetical protein [Alisedimentitalea sp. MJ-SS2]